MTGRNHSLFVMVGLVPAIRAFCADQKSDIDARRKAGHDEVKR